MTPIIKHSQIIRKDLELNITGKELIELLNTNFKLNIPNKAEVYVSIPGGGDWSNTSLDIDKSSPIIIKWTTIDESHH